MDSGSRPHNMDISATVSPGAQENLPQRLPRSLVSSIACGYIAAADNANCASTYTSPKKPFGPARGNVYDGHSALYACNAGVKSRPNCNKDLAVLNTKELAVARPYQKFILEANAWEDLVEANIPSYTYANLQDVPRFETLYHTYQATYTEESTVDNATRMMLAKALVFTLLTHFYPKSQGYIVKPSTLGPVTRYGMSFMLKSMCNDQNHITKSRSLKKSAPSKEGMSYAMNTVWRWIKPNDIAAFVVLAKLDIIDHSTGKITQKYTPHTYFAIMIDAKGLPSLSKGNSTLPSDVLSDALCRNAQIREGYGLLLYGPRLEFYKYNAGKEWVFHEDEEEESEDEYQDMEPVMEPILEAGVHDMAIDMRESDVSLVEEVFREKIVSRCVTYMEGVVGTKAATSDPTVIGIPR